jgi:hypothetical protein
MSLSRSSLAGQARGSWRGGTGRGCRRGAWYPKPLPEAPLGPYGPTIDSIDIKALLIEEDSPKIANVEYVASYNWLDGAEPTVLIPGEHPPSLSIPKLPSITCSPKVQC